MPRMILYVCDSDHCKAESLQPLSFVVPKGWFVRHASNECAGKTTTEDSVYCSKCALKLTPPIAADLAKALKGASS